ncbi:MAG TPA: retropepsin-like aspartic protease [Candidatus Binatia bacterium]|nr:retropepsin-like aspartic protease [Candidatus Binatia bacterium]
MMVKTADHDSIAGGDSPAVSSRSFRRFLALMTLVAVAAGMGPNVHDASSQPQPSSKAPVEVFSSAEETATVVETVSDGAALRPMAEMMGPGGAKWFMVKTPAGNVGWIKTGDNSAARQIDGHFRSLPKESTSIGPARNSPEGKSKIAAQGSITIPIQVRGRHIIVPVTFNDSVTGNLVLDTGAGQTMISKRIANDLRLYSDGAGTRIGIGGAVSVATATIDVVRVGDADVKNLRVSIHDIPFNSFEEGLLGIDFLGRFQMSLDIEKGVLILAPRKG